MNPWTEADPGELTTGTLARAALPPATTHVRRATLKRAALASRIAAAGDPEGDAWRLLAYVYGCTPVTLMRPGALAEHCGLTDDRADQVLGQLIGKGLLAEGSTVTRASVVGRALVAAALAGE